MNGMHRALAILAAMAVSADAAPETELALRIVPMPRGAPDLEATIIPCPDPSHLTLGVGSWRAPSTSVQRWRDGDQPLALALLVAGQEVAMGNDTIETPDSAAFMPGILSPLALALTRAKLAETTPRGSVGALITYATGATVRAPLGPIAALDGAALGTQHDYYSKIGSDLVSGLERALLVLDEARAPQRALVVIGDGNDTNADTARPRLAELRKRAQQANIHLFAIVYKSSVSDERNDITTLVPHAHTVNSAAGIQDELAAIVNQLGDRCVARFSTEGLRTESQTTEYVLRAGDRTIATYAMTWNDGYRPPAPVRRWPALVVGGLGVVGLAIGVLALLRRRARATSPPPAAWPS